MITGATLTQALHVAAKLGIADLLKDGPRPSDDVARATNTHPRSLYRLLRALASVGVFEEVEPGIFGLTPPAVYLQTGVPQSLRALAILRGEPFYWQGMGGMLYSVQTGQAAFDHQFGVHFFDYLAQNPQAEKAFAEAMGAHGSLSDLRAIAAAYDFGQCRQVVDVGGGYGGLIAAILMEHPATRGVLLDVPGIAEEARRYLVAAGVADRCQFVGGDFRQEVPSGGDVYVMKSVIHNWSDDEAVVILKNVGRAMAENGRVLVVEMVISPGHRASTAKLLDLHMLTLFGGCQRTEDEYRNLYEAAGLTLTRIIPTETPFQLIEGVRA